MKERWLTLVLRLTNLIYQRKQSEVGKQGVASVGNITVLMFWEVVLLLVSLPLYLTTSTTKVVGFLESKGGYAKIAVDYRLRRVLTLTGVGVVFLIWVIKFSFLMLTPQLYGPMHLYSVTESGPRILNDQTIVIQDTNMQTAKVNNLLVMPAISGLEKVSGNRYRFFGTGKAGLEVVLFLTGNQNVMYVEKVGTDGKWTIEHSQNDLKLSNGIHSVFAFHYEKDQGVRSKTTAENYFRISSSFGEQLSANMDNLANWLVVLLIILGILLTLLTV